MGLLLVALTLSCRVDPDGFSRSGDRDEVVSLSLEPPPSPPEGEKLYQLLYRDEHGDLARPAGQRARMLAWLVTLELSEQQLEGLASLQERFAREAVAYEAEMAEIAALEAKEYAPIYASIIAHMAGDAPFDETKLALLADQLQAAHTTVDAAQPHAIARDRLLAQINAVEYWTNSLTEVQRQRLSHGRFFLRRRLGPLSQPGDYESMIGTMWDAGDYDSIRYTERANGESAMNVGGLWSAERIRTGPNRYLMPMQLKTVVFLALTEPGMGEAVAVLRGLRHPLDF